MSLSWKITWTVWYLFKALRSSGQYIQFQTNQRLDDQERKGKSVHRNQLLTFHWFHFHFTLTSFELSLFQGLEDYHRPQPQSPATLGFHFKCQPPRQKEKRKKGSQHLAREWSYICSREAGCWPRSLLRLAFGTKSGHSPWIHFSNPFLFHCSKPCTMDIKVENTQLRFWPDLGSQESQINANGFQSSPLSAKPSKWPFPIDGRKSKFRTAKLNESWLLT